MPVDGLEFDQIAALCRAVLSHEEVYALDQTIMAEAMTELGRLCRSSVTVASPQTDDPSGRPLRKPQRRTKIKLVGA